MSLPVVDFVPTGSQQIVRYFSDEEDDVHKVETPTGLKLLAKKSPNFDSTLPFYKDDCLVIDQIKPTGNKEIYDILYTLPLSTVLDLIKSERWPANCQDDELYKENLIEFFSSSVNNNVTDFPYQWSSDNQLENAKVKLSLVEDDSRVSRSNNKRFEENCGEGLEEEKGYKSRVEFVTSGVVTVASVAELNAMEHGIQSLDFETEESSEESSSSSPLPIINPRQLPKDFQRQANTIRIQVNYPQGSQPPQKNRKSTPTPTSNDLIHST